MKTMFRTLTAAVCCLTAMYSCSNAEIEDKGKADADGRIELNVEGVLGEYEAEETKSSLVNNIRVGWERHETKKDTVLVFHKEKQTYLGYLVATVRNDDDRCATLSGTITAPEGDEKTLVFIHGTGLNPSGFTEKSTYEYVTLDLSAQGDKTPFMVYGTSPFRAAEVSNIIVDFSFATSVVSTYAAGLPANTEVTRATLSGINTKCEFDISTLEVSGKASGTITKSAGIGSTNAQGQVLFKIAVPASEAAAFDRSVVFTTSSKTYTAGFSGAAIVAGKAYSAMSETHSVEVVVLDKTSATIFADSDETLTATVYPNKSNPLLTWASSNDAVATVNQEGKVHAVAPGAATITATSNDNPSIIGTCAVKVYPKYVTIGGLKWATRNLGATTDAGSGETCYGDYYAWGEKVPYYADRTWDNEKKTWIFSKWNSGKEKGYMWESYCGSSSFVEWSPAPYDGTMYNLTTEYDVVQQKVGDGWRMPTSQEFKDLSNACGGCISGTLDGHSSADDLNVGVYWCGNYDGVAGLLFCDGINKLFFPAAGASYMNEFAGGGEMGCYWSSTCYRPSTEREDSDKEGNAYILTFGILRGEPNIKTQSDYERFAGISVRPVSD